jgi:hypothetical protein
MQSKVFPPNEDAMRIQPLFKGTFPGPEGCFNGQLPQSVDSRPLQKGKFDEDYRIRPDPAPMQNPNS